MALPRVPSSLLVALLLAIVAPASSLDNGLAITPPLGWRSWNCFHGDVDDAKIRSVVDAMTAPVPGVPGESLSLHAIGYEHVGVDDGWQLCGTGWAPAGQKPSFHAKDGTPLVNTSKFPSLKGLVDYGHGKKMKMG